MSKKSKEKNKPEVYSRAQFRDIICNNCRICNNYYDRKFEPFFCHQGMYLKNPKDFMDYVYRNITSILNTKGGEWPTGDLELLVFEATFCKSGVCEDVYLNAEGRCIKLDDCLYKFHGQMNGNLSKKKRDGIVGFIKGKIDIPRKREVRPEKKRIVVQPYPSFISNGGDAWEKEMEAILNKV